MEHHERLDGGGYPKGVAEQGLCRPGKILSLVEFAVGLAQGGTLDDPNTVVKLSIGKFDREAVGVLIALLSARQRRRHARGDAGEVRHLLRLLDRILSDWLKVGANESSPTEEAARASVAAGVDAVKHTLVRVGLSPEGDPTGLQVFGDDPKVLQDLRGVLREARYQIREILKETALRWPEIPSSGGTQ